MSKKILIISPTSTHPPFSGNAKCILSYAEMLTEAGYDIFFLWVADYNSTLEEEALTRKYWKDNLTIFKLNLFHRVLKAFYRYIRFNIRGNYKIDDFHPYGIKRVLKKIQKNTHFDSVIVNYVFFSKVFKHINNSKKILYTHDVFTNKYQHTGNPWFSVTANEEAKALDRADTILAIQENEGVFFSYLTTKKVLTAYSFFPISVTPFTGRKVLLFLAGSNSHNLEAITTFIDSVFRILIPIHPDIKLLIGGSICNVISHAYQEDSIEFFGEVNDLIDFYSLGDIFINPTFNGTGLKIKTFEAMAYGKVVISHPHNTIGIYKREQAPILIAQNYTDYINHINSLFESNEKILEVKNESMKYILDLNSIAKSRFIEAIEN
jgi:glycosyltransferase involved in cell wall biosynthesis